jgi:hypothetical protein
VLLPVPNFLGPVLSLSTSKFLDRFRNVVYFFSYILPLLPGRIRALAFSVSVPEIRTRAKAELEQGINGG